MKWCEFYFTTFDNWFIHRGNNIGASGASAEKVGRRLNCFDDKHNVLYSV